MALREGLRNEDINLLTREFRALREKGAGIEEAWAGAKVCIKGVTPATLDGWKPDIIKKAEAGTVAAPIRGVDVITKVSMLEEENAKLKRQIAEQGDRIEKLSGSKLGEDNAKLKAEISKLREQLAAAEELLGEKKGK